MLWSDSRNTHWASILSSPRVDNTLQMEGGLHTHHVPVLLPGGRMVSQPGSSVPLRSLNASGEASRKQGNKPSCQWDILSMSALKRRKPGNVCIRWGQRRLSGRGKCRVRNWPRQRRIRGNREGRIPGLFAWKITGRKKHRSLLHRLIALSALFFSITYTCKVFLSIQEKPSRENIASIAFYSVILTSSNSNNFAFGFPDCCGQFKFKNLELGYFHSHCISVFARRIWYTLHLYNYCIMLRGVKGHFE